jgi:hypothetical protein
MADFLDEDIQIRNQLYCVLSYTLPKPGDTDTKGKKRVGFDTPMIKFRGSYATVEECEARIERLKPTDKYFHMYVAPVGTWGPLLTEEQHKESGTNAVFMNKEMNDFMKGYKESQDKQADLFEERKKSMAEQARLEGTKEGQAFLASKKENPISVKDRITKTEDTIKELTQKLKEAQELHDKAVELYATYSQEEIDTAITEINSLKIDN